jgi:hypothetical protein
MEFGHKTRFGIAVELDENHGGSWLFGRFCYWIAGEMVGDYNSGTSLRDVLFQMKYIIDDRGKRFSPDLLNFSNEKMFHLIFSALSEGDDEIFRYVKDDLIPARFDVCIPADIFDSWRIFLVDGANDARLLYF